ncbi:MAG: glycosyltransferase [Planctomycetota bacterium]|jgi:GT2 family glycosyltransferase
MASLTGARTPTAKREEQTVRATVYTTTCDGKLPLLTRLVDGIRTYTHVPYRLVVVDNGTNDGTGKYLSRQRDIRVIRSETNLHDGLGSNLAIAAADTDYTVKLDTDTLVCGHHWLRDTIRYMDSNPDVGIAGDVWDAPAGITGDFKRGGHDTSLFNHDWWVAIQPGQSLPHVQGGYMAICRRMVDAIGPFNPAFTADRVIYVDVELSWRALSHGWQLGSLSFVLSGDGHNRRVDPSLKCRIYHPVKELEHGIECQPAEVAEIDGNV